MAARSWLLLPIFAFASARAHGAVACDELGHLKLANTTVLTAVSVPAGGFAPVHADQGRGSPPRFDNLPAFCRIVADVITSADSRIRIEVWLPAAQWNGKFLAVGWAFFARTMSPALLSGPLRRGYATATTDGGGRAGDPSFLLNHPERVKDWGQRAWHETVVKSKAMCAAYYGSPPKFTYWNGGGGAGRQGAKAAQAYAEDFDGIAIGGLASDSTHFTFAQLLPWIATRQEGALLSEKKLDVLHRAVIAACDARDGVKDGVISDPERCKFDPVAFQCRDADGPGCLTAAQVTAARTIYAGPTNPRTGKRVFGSFMPGSEMAWGALMQPPGPGNYAVDFFRYIAFKDPDWDPATLNFDRDVARAEQVDASVNAVDPDISAFVRRGGKLLMWGGWSDTAIPPAAETGFYQAILTKWAL